MADKTYTEDALTLKVDKKDELHPTSVTPTAESLKERRLSARGNAPEVADDIAAFVDGDPKRLRLPAGTTGATFRELARRARRSGVLLAAAEAMVAMLKREDRLRKHELQRALMAAYKQLKAQREDDARLWDDLESLVEYFGNK